MTRVIRVGWVVAVVAALSGCGTKQAEISGTVSYAGELIQTGSIAFEPVDGQGTPGGCAIKDGRYSVLDAPVGPVRVRIRGTKVIGKKTTTGPGGGERDVVQDFVPEKYNINSTLLFDIQRGSNAKNFDLTAD